MRIRSSSPASRRKKNARRRNCAKNRKNAQRSNAPGSKALALGQAGLALYQGASADGSKVFFTTKQELMNKDDKRRHGSL